MDLDTRMLGPDPLDSIITGDARELAKAIPDESVDVSFPDPPYGFDYLFLFDWVAQESSRILKPGGRLFTLTGGTWVIEVLDFLRQTLPYQWICCLYHPSENAVYRVFPKHVFSYGKPILWFTKGHDAGPFLRDGISSNSPDKSIHKWGPAEHWASSFIRRFPHHWIIFDPFCGGGTLPSVCKELNRRYLAFEIDAVTAEHARERVRLTPLPRPFDEPEPLALCEGTYGS